METPTTITDLYPYQIRRLPSGQLQVLGEDDRNVGYFNNQQAAHTAIAYDRKKRAGKKVA